MRFDILENPEHGTYRWKMQAPPDAGYICQSSTVAFDSFAAAAQDARRFRRTIGAKAVVPRKLGPS